MSYRTVGDLSGVGSALGKQVGKLIPIPVLGDAVGILVGDVFGRLLSSDFWTGPDAQIAAWNQFMAAELQRSRLQSPGTQRRSLMRARLTLARRH